MSNDEGGESPCLTTILDDLVGEPDDRDLAQLLRDLADAVVICDRDGTIVFWNDAAAAMFGWSALEAAGKTLELIVPPRLWSRHAIGFARVMETGHTDYGNRLRQVPAKHRDGHVMSLAFTVTLMRRARLQLPIGVAAIIRLDPDWKGRQAAIAKGQQLKARRLQEAVDQ